MFWQSLLYGFSVFAHLQGWGAVATCVFLGVALRIGVDLLNADRTESASPVGLVQSSILEPVLHGFMFGFVVVLVMPVLFDRPYPMPMLLATGLVARAAVAVLIAVVAVTFVKSTAVYVPGFDVVLADSPAVTDFLVGGMVLRASAEAYLNATGDPVSLARAHPGMLAITGYVAIAVVLTLVGAWLQALMASLLKPWSVTEEVRGVFQAAWGQAVAILTLSMYAAHIRLVLARGTVW